MSRECTEKTTTLQLPAPLPRVDRASPEKTLRTTCPASVAQGAPPACASIAPHAPHPVLNPRENLSDLGEPRAPDGSQPRASEAWWRCDTWRSTRRKENTHFGGKKGGGERTAKRLTHDTITTKYTCHTPDSNHTHNAQDGTDAHHTPHANDVQNKLTLRARHTHTHTRGNGDNDAHHTPRGAELAEIACTTGMLLKSDK